MSSLKKAFSLASIGLCVAMGCTSCSSLTGRYPISDVSQEVVLSEVLSPHTFPELEQPKEQEDEAWRGKSEKTLHLCIDVQKVYERIYTVPWWKEMKANISDLADKLEKKGVKTVYVGYDEAFVPLKKGVDFLANVPSENKEKMTENNEAMNFDFSLKPSDLVAFKKDFSAYRQKEIARYVKEGGYQTIILSGVWEGAVGQAEDSFCITETARDFGRAGYEVIIAKEGTQRGMKGWYDYDQLQNRRELHAQWGVNILSSQTIVKGLEEKAFSESPRPDNRKTAGQAIRHPTDSPTVL